MRRIYRAIQDMGMQQNGGIWGMSIIHGKTNFTISPTMSNWIATGTHTLRVSETSEHSHT